MDKTRAVCAAGVLLSAGMALGQGPFLSELLINPPGSDNGYERVEVTGEPGGSLSGLYLLSIDGDGDQAGTVDQVVDLGALASALGSNGVLLVRDIANATLPEPSPETALGLFNFEPDLENGTQTFVLCRFEAGASPPAVGFDIDLNNTGVIDNPIVGLIVLDAVSYREDPTTGQDREYAEALGGTNGHNLAQLQANGSNFTPDVLYRVLGPDGRPIANANKGWIAADVQTVPTVPLGGPYPFDTVRRFGFEVYPSPANPLPTQADAGVRNYVYEVGCPGTGSGACGLGDWNEDGAIDFNDLLAFLNDYTAQTPCSDLSGDGVVDFNDLLEFLNRFNTPC